MIVGDTVKVAGGLLPAQLLERIVAGDPTLPGTKASDYHCDSTNELNQAINRAWAALCGRWATFKPQLDRLPANDRATTLTREKWLLPLFQELGYGRLPSQRAALVFDERTFAISHLWGHTPIHLLGAGLKLDKRVDGERGAAASPPHGLVQDLLNTADEHLWAFLSNGKELRLLRDYRSLTRHAYISFDLEAIFDGEQFSAFRLLWLVCHQSRVEAEKPSECWLEAWVGHAQRDGVRALDRLRVGVETAIAALGRGFLKHRGNETLKARLSSGDLATQEYYRQLLKLVYRLIFLFVAEDRDLLLVPDAPDTAKDRYRKLYATRRLRGLAMKRRGGPHDDGWQALRLVMRQLDRGNPELALPGLGSFLWSTDARGEQRVSRAIPDLDPATITNEDLFAALLALCVVQDGPVRRPVDWAGVQADELGSVYESLMEKVPRMNVVAGTFELADAAGNDRKTSGSYYTPTSLVDFLLDTALDPVLDKAMSEQDPARAILGLCVVDPACGSGHFLVAAARRMAHRLAKVRCGGIEPSPPDVQHALRDVVGRCIYGVDLNPMAVELCKVSLWMEAIEPGRPLSFLDGHIRHGNALLGATPELMDRGIPNEAWAPLEGDEKGAAKRLRAFNRTSSGQGTQLTLIGAGAPLSPAELAKKASAIDEGDDETLDAVQARAEAWEGYERSTEGLRLIADLWCAAFVWPKRPGIEEQAAPVASLWAAVKTKPQLIPETTKGITQSLARQYHFFHWHLAFPQVFERGGFDVVLGNPPWERVKLQEQEFFATRNEPIANAQNAAARKKLIAALPTTDPVLWTAWCEASREAQGQSHFVRQSGRYPLCGKGDVNTYALFAEHNWHLLGPRGRAGFIVPSGIATDDTTKDYFQAIMRTRALHSMWEFENEGFFTAGKGHMLRFALTTLSGRDDPAEAADFMFQGLAVSDLDDPQRHFTLSAEDIETINPNTGTCPIFRTRRDASLALTLYRKAGVLWREGDPNGNPWGLRFMAMFHMANDSELFRTRGELVSEGWRLEGNRFVRDGQVMLPLYEAKMAHIYTHRSGSYETAAPGERPHRLPTPTDERLADTGYSPLPFYWVAQCDVDSKLDGVSDLGWVLGWRNITDARASIRCVVPVLLPRVAVGHATPLMFSSKEPRQVASLMANLCCLPLDYAARQKVGGLNLTYGYLRQFPVIAPSKYSEPVPWTDVSLGDWLLPRILELTYTAWDLQPFAQDCGDDGPPYIWDADRRFQLQCELDAAFFHLYGVSREDAEYILGTFDVLERADIRNHGEFRTQRVILEIYDALAHAAASRQPYVSPLGPPRRAAMGSRPMGS
ncbi:MAG: N-6 DNA methylase [Pseudomonadota bacterium]